MYPVKSLILSTFCVILTLFSPFSAAAVLAEAVPEIKISLTRAPTSQPMTIAYEPQLKQYYIADGGLAPTPDDPQGAPSQSEIHAYDASGAYISSAKPGLDNRSIYYNNQTQRLESVTYNVSSDAGFGPNTGIFALIINEDGSLKGGVDEISGYNPAFGSANVIPSYDTDHGVYYAKQERSNTVRVVKQPKREPVREIKLDLDAAHVRADEIAHYFIAYTGSDEAELALLDVEHKAVLVFDLNGKFIAKSALPGTLKLRSRNHIAGTGYCNNLFFVYDETDGEFGTYYGFRILD